MQRNRRFPRLLALLLISVAGLLCWILTREKPSAVIRHFTPRVPITQGQRSVNVSGPEGSTSLMIDVRRIEGNRSSVFASISSRETLQALRLLTADDVDGDGIIAANEWQLVAEGFARRNPEGVGASFKAEIGIHDAYRVQEVYSDYAPCNTDQTRLGMEIAK